MHGSTALDSTTPASGWTLQTETILNLSDPLGYNTAHAVVASAGAHTVTADSSGVNRASLIVLPPLTRAALTVTTGGSATLGGSIAPPAAVLTVTTDGSAALMSSGMTKWRPRIAANAWLAR